MSGQRFSVAGERRPCLPGSVELILSANGIVLLHFPVRTRELRMNRDQVVGLRDLLDHVLDLGSKERA